MRNDKEVIKDLIARVHVMRDEHLILLNSVRYQTTLIKELYLREDKLDQEKSSETKPRLWNSIVNRFFKKA